MKERLSLRTLLTLQYLICIALLFLIQFCVVNIILYPRHAQIEEELVQSQVESEAEKIGAMIYRELGVLTSLSKTYALTDMDFYTYNSYVQEYDRGLSSSGKESSRRIILCDTDKKIYSDNDWEPNLSKEDFLASLWMQSDKTGIFYLEDITEQEEEKGWIVMATLLLDREGKHGGYLLSCLEAKEILSSFSAAIFPENAIVWLADSQGEMLGEEEIRKGLTAYGESDQEKLKQILAEKTEKSSGLFTVDLNKGATVGFSEIPETYGWKLYVLWSNTGLDSHSEQYAAFSWLLWTVLVAILTATALCIAANVVRPMEQLTAIIQNVDEKDAEPVKQHFFIREIERLAQSVNEMQTRINQLFDNMKKKEEAKRNAERKMLQAQITPHFLYNTLDNISWRAISCGNCQIPDIVNALSSFFHISLSDGREFITWNEEAEHVYSYLFIQQMRYEDRLDFDLDLDQSLKHYHVIKLLLQPLVENALYHGIKPKEGRGHIQVDIRACEEDKVLVKIEDDGIGMSPLRLKEVKAGLEAGIPEAGFGLCTTVQRLRLTYGEGCRFSIHSEEKKGTFIEIILPREERREHD